MDLFGLVGFPLSHSFSKRYFSNKFEEENIEAEYLNFEIEDIARIRGLIANDVNLRGLNITIPYKESVIPFLDFLSEEVRSIGAVNVVKVEYRGSSLSPILTGYNTDYVGFRDSILPLINGKGYQKALVLGTGGASKAVKYAFDSMGIETLFVSRNKEGSSVISYNNLTPQIIESHKIIVNTTPIGTFPNIDDFIDISYAAITNQHVVYDLIYNPSETVFLSRAKEQGATIKNGGEMLTIQAEEAWRIWNR